MYPGVVYSRREYLGCVVLAALTLVVFLPTCGNDFVNYDDNIYVLGNRHLKAGLTRQNVLWALTEPYAGNWHPLTWLSLQLDYQLYGLKPLGYHLTNVLLHTANVLLLFVALRHLTRTVWCSAFVAAFFAVHPLHVESVAWVSERKDVLSTFFWMLTLLAYSFYVDRRSVSRYLLLALVFALGLTAKPMLVTLPLVVLLLDYWPLGRLFPSTSGPGQGTAETVRAPAMSLIYEKLPLLALTTASCVLTWYAQQHGQAMPTLQNLPLAARIQNALVAYWEYMGKALWPVGLAAFYPHPGPSFSAQKMALAGAGLAAVTIACVILRHRLPYLIVGWLWYLGTLVPVIGLVQVGVQANADRYTYVPLIGLFLAATWGAADLATWRRRQPLAIALGGALVIVYMLYSLLQGSYWRDSETLWRHTLEVTRDNGVAHDGLGGVYVKQEKWDQAIPEYRRALQLLPGYMDALTNLSRALLRRGRTADAPEAASLCAQILRINPRDAEAYYNLGIALERQKRLSVATDAFLQSFRLDPTLPDDVQAREKLGLLFFDRGRALSQDRKWGEAAEYLYWAVKLQPNAVQYRRSLADVLKHQREETRSAEPTR
jgi:tetratricopeptide (TPR) repeat protein